MKFNIKYCAKCDEKFIPVNNTQKFCQDPCTTRNLTIQESNQNWVARKIKSKKLNKRKDYQW